PWRTSHAASRPCGTTTACALVWSSGGARGPGSSAGRAARGRPSPSMTPRFPRPLVLLTVAACVSFDPAGPPVRDISGNYTGTVVTRIVNQFEVRSDTFGATLALRGTQNRGHFSGTYSLATDEAGPVAGVLRPGDTPPPLDLGAAPKPLPGGQRSGEDTAGLQARFDLACRPSLVK